MCYAILIGKGVAINRLYTSMPQVYSINTALEQIFRDQAATFVEKGDNLYICPFLQIIKVDVQN